MYVAYFLTNYLPAAGVSAQQVHLDLFNADQA